MLRFARSLLLLLFGVIIGSVVTSWYRTASPAAQTPSPAAGQPPSLEADVAHLKDVVPAQSHSMIDVGYHMANLWFAVQQKNWDFAAFEVDETRNRIRWTIRISPTRKGPDGQTVDLKGIFDGIDPSVLTPLKESVQKKDAAAFVTAYKATLEACYSCHKASGKPYLRPMIPTIPPQAIINYDPAAAWPQ